MTSQEQAFRAYYRSMDDVELLGLAANRESFISLAQQLMAEEISSRGLTVPLAAPKSLAAKSDFFSRLLRRFHRSA